MTIVLRPQTSRRSSSFQTFCVLDGEIKNIDDKQAEK